MTNMQISYNGIKALTEHEGFRSNAYKDTGGVWTIGYGTICVDGKPVEQGMTCTIPQAEEWMRSDLAWAQTAVNQLVRTQLFQHQFDALVSFVYNIGQTAFAKSTMLRKLNMNDFIGASKEFDRWNKDNGKTIAGLVARRAVEQAMFEGPSGNS